jgi:Fe-S oxidoreductase
MMTAKDLNQDRLGWLEDTHEVSPTSDTIYFSGCLPYYEVLFQDMGVEALSIARSAVSIMNQAGMVPHVMPNERCCGHDQLWQGDLNTFEQLARQNLALFEATGASQIVTTCPECAYTLKYDYPRHGIGHDLQIVHMSELLTDLIDQDRFGLQPKTISPQVTYQDPCRLARHMRICEEPREILTASGFGLVEMQKNRTQALCCGTSCWTACGRVNKQIQTERLMQAKATGAEMLVTACIKCQIHLKCAQKDRMLQDDIGIEIRDLTTVVAEGLGFKDSRGRGAK